jgi:CheY-like chemotaxis protein
VDDNAANRRVLQLQLERNGCEVQAVGSACEALAVLCAEGHPQRGFDAMLTDFHMPGTDGVTLVGSVRKLPKLQSLPVLILASHMDQLRDAGVGEVLRKPVRESNLVRSLHRLFSVQPNGQKALADTPAPLIVETNPVKGRVLLAEDNAVNQKVASLLLRKIGYSVDVAGDGRAALEALQMNFYDLILMDCQMPEMDGFEATRAIRRNAACRDLPIIALTANAFPGEKEKCIAAGMNDYLAKPIKCEVLAQMLSDWIGQKPVQSFHPPPNIR